VSGKELAKEERRVASGERSKVQSEKTGGNADVCENKRVAKKAICKYMETKGLQIDW
jgi:hypothetical protein